MSHYEVYGALGSPYSMKVRAAMRAKRLVHTWTGLTAEERGRVMPNVKAPVIPVIHRPDGSWTNDSTPFLLSVEAEGRSLLPDDPVARFACLLLEDMADEWFMKAMFHFRWAYADDAEWCANWLMFDSLPNAGLDSIEAAAANIRERQISRMALVGCTPATGPLIEASWRRACIGLEAMATGPGRFLFGNRLSLADAAFYGQLKVMSYDPTPMVWLQKDGDGLRVAWLLDVVVRPDWRGRGLGSAIVRLLVEHPRARGARELRLRTRDAQNFYARFGFQPLAPGEEAIPTLRRAGA